MRCLLSFGTSRTSLNAGHERESNTSTSCRALSVTETQDSLITRSFETSHNQRHTKIWFVSLKDVQPGSDSSGSGNEEYIRPHLLAQICALNAIFGTSE